MKKLIFCLLTRQSNKRQTACCGFAISILLLRLAFQAMVSLARNASLRSGLASLSHFLSYLTVGLILPLLIGAEGPRKKQIDLVQAWTEPNNQAFVQGGHLGNIFHALKEKNVTLVATDLKDEKDSLELTYVVLYSKPWFLKTETLKKIPQKKRLLFTWEPPVFQPGMYKKEFLDLFKRVYTWDDDLVDNKKFFKFYYPNLQPMIQDRPPFEERKLLTQLSSNKKSKHPKELYKAREDVIRFFEDKPEGVFEFYGLSWEKKGYKNYRGMVDNKIDALKQYRFSVCYENMCDE